MKIARIITLVLSRLAAALQSLSLVAADPSIFDEGPAVNSGSSVRPASGRSWTTTADGFVPNVGQVTNEAVKFTLSDRGMSAYFTDHGFLLWNGQTIVATRDGVEMEVPVAPSWQVIGAKRVEPVGGAVLSHTVSFFRGRDSANWHANVPAYREIRYPEILQGIDLSVETRDGGFEYSFHVRPSAKADLRFRYDGITAIEKSPTGGLMVWTATGHFIESRPISYQIIDGTRREVETSFEVVSPIEYRIAVGPYDQRHELVIDPVLDWSTFLGTTHLDELRDVRADANGNIYVAGMTSSTDLPDTAAFTTGPGVNYSGGVWYTDAFVAKLDPSGTSLLWLGYLGGTGNANDAPGNNGLAVDSLGDVYVAGYTESPDFPSTDSVANAGAFDAFVTKIRSDGSAILWSSLLGGNNVDWGWAIALDPEENILLTGFTLSDDFPVSPFSPTLRGARDAFLTKLDSSGAVQWSRYLGGTGNADRAASVVANAAGEIFVFGDTDSQDFADGGDTTLGGANDAFVTKLDADGTTVWTTLFGGLGVENNEVNPYSPVAFSRGDIALDSTGNILIAGETTSTSAGGFPVTPGAFDITLNGTTDGYVAKIDKNDAHVVWATYLGGSGGGQYQDRVWGIAVNPWDEIFLAGRTDSPSFPVTSNAVQPTFRGGLQDGFLTKLSANGSQLLYSTYLGGSQSRDTTIGVTYHAGAVIAVGWAASGNFPTTAGAYQTGCFSCSLNGWDDGVILRFLDAFVAQDGFESGNYSGGSGWTGNWVASGDTSILTSSGPHSGNRHVRLSRNTGLLRRTVNVPPGAATIRLGFWGKVESFEGSDKAFVRVKKSTGGSFSTVVTVTFTPADGDNAYHYREWDLTSFLPATQFQIEFDAEMNATNDNWYLDDIRVVGTE